MGLECLNERRIGPALRYLNFAMGSIDSALSHNPERAKLMLEVVDAAEKYLGGFVPNKTARDNTNPLVIRLADAINAYRGGRHDRT